MLGGFGEVGAMLVRRPSILFRAARDPGAVGLVRGGMGK